MGPVGGGWGRWGRRWKATGAGYPFAIILAILACFFGTADAIPTLKNPAPLLRQDGVSIAPWGNDGQNTPTDEGGVNYFVSPNGNDNNDGRVPERPFRNVSRCVSARASGTNCLFERGGVWVGTLDWENIPSGNSSNYTVFGAYGNTSAALPVIDNDGAGERIRGGRAYIWFDRLNLRDNGRSWVEDGSHHVVFSNGRVDSRYTCFGVSGLPSNNRGHHVTFANFDIGPCGFSTKPCTAASNTSGFEGFYLGNSDPNGFGCIDVDIYNVRIRDTTKDPFNIKERCDNVSFRFSVIEDQQQCDDAGIISGADFPDKNNIHIYGNIIRNVSKPNKSGAVFSMGQGMRAENNMVCGVRDFHLIHFGTDARDTAGLFNSSFYDFQTVTGGGHTASQNVHIKNNIGPGGISGNINSSAGLWNSTAACHLLLKAGSAAINAASSCQGVVRDITWSERPVGGACDMGAHEFNGTGAPPDPPPPPPPVRLDNYVAKPANGGSDTNDGSVNAPWATIQKCINSGLVNPGSSCEVRAGEYNENLVIGSKFGTSYANGFTIRPAVGVTVTIKPLSGANAVLLTDNSAFVALDAIGTGHIIVDGANITGAAIYTTGYAGSTGSSADNSRIREVEIKNAPSYAVFNDPGTTAMEFISNYVHNNGLGIAVTSGSNTVGANFITDNAGIGVYVLSHAGSAPSFSKIFNNRITNNADTGIHINAGGNISAWNNVLVGNLNHGVFLGAATSAAGVHFNLAYQNGGYGFTHDNPTGPFIFSNIWHGNTTGEFNAPPGASLSTNFTVNPLWTDPANANFTLQSASPALNTATCIAELSSDFLGNARPDPVHQLCDGGPYEGVGSITPPPPEPPPQFSFWVAKNGLDTNNGQSATPFLTIQRCINAMTQLGSVCEVRDGEYNENLTVASKFGTSYANGFRIQPAAGHTVTIKPLGGQNVVLLTDNSSFIEFTAIGTGHMIFDSINTAGAAIFVTGYQGTTGSSADNSRFRDIEIRHAPNYAAFNDAGTSAMEYIGNNIHNNAAGLEITSTNNVVAANIIADNTTTGIHVFSHGGSSPGGQRIFNNIVRNNGSTAIKIDGGTGSSAWNNIVYANGQHGIWLTSATISGAGIHFNLSYNNVGYGFSDAGSTGAFIFSNIFWGNQTVNFNPAAGANLATNFQVDPLWTDPANGNFTLQSTSPVINKATCIAELPADIANNPRPDMSGLCDAGPYERVASVTPPPPTPEPQFRFWVAKNGSDANNGQSGTPFLTIQKCINAMVELGSTCEVRAGEYNETVTIASKVGTSHTAGYTLKPAVGATVTIKPPSGTGAIVLTDNTSYFTVTAEGDGHMILDGTNLTGVCALVTGYQGPTGLSANNSIIRAIEIRNCPTYGIYSNSGSRSMEFIQNHIHHNDTGIGTTSQSNLILANLIEDNTSSGIWLTPIGGSSPSQSLIQNNMVRNNGGNGLRIDSGTGISAWNNIYANNGGHGVFLEDAEVIGAGIHFSAFWSNGGHGFIDGGADGPFIFSNIFWQNEDGNLTLATTNPTVATNYMTDPIWTNPAAGDFSLRSDSPALNTATCIAELNTDYYANPRPDATSGRCDHGPIEGAGSLPPPASENAQMIFQGGVLEGGQIN
jgi:Right handed beta helix region/Periplasmic copper-binding protein (NosD)